ncbi:hypothetical protein Pmani_030534 [Petrolisthes manimaculis]|uniref:Beta/gamma crystallin 'Greek key' domain-containing protein n=1 Tax=Petrolisthes manimaculis TaxID=1843537 RepID=A0AAE1NXC9_9EUCA|nr:hypothetical protein Pmani_030534 [Petrolisthes manimaculis]
MYTRGLLLLVVLPLVVTMCTGASVPEERTYAGEAKCWSGDSHLGESMKFNDNNPHLGSVGFDNTIQSVKVTGMWIFYDDPDYNSNTADSSRFFYVHGLDYSMTIPDEYKNKATSLRYAGSQHKLNDDYWSIYQGMYFAGDTLGGTNDMTDLSFLTFDAFSVILVGKTAWSFCEGVNYAGPCVCMWPDTHHDDTLFRELDLGIFPTLTSYGGILRVRSVRKGCYGKVISSSSDSGSSSSSSSRITHVSQGTEGGFGYIEKKKID